jgi:hypothetical protein
MEPTTPSCCHANTKKRTREENMIEHTADQDVKRLRADAPKSSQNDTAKYNSEELGEILECSICRDIMIHPFILHCSHTFCKKCVVDWLRMNKSCHMQNNDFKTASTK